MGLLSLWRRILPWTILTFGALNVIFLGGKRRAFGIFVAQLHVEYNNTSLAELNWIGDSYAALGYLTSTLSSATILYFNRRFALFQFVGACFVLLACLTSAYVPSPHWLFLTHTILHGIGSSLILSAVGLVVNEHFGKNHKYHILATTLVSGGSVASIVFVQFYAYIIQEYGWREAFIILGVMYFFVNASGGLIFTKNPALGEYKENKCSFDFQGHVKGRQMPLLVLWTIDRMMTSIVTYGILLNLADYDYVHRHGTSLTKSAVLTTLFASGEASTYAIGAVITGLTQTFFKNRLRYVLATCTFCMACSLVLWEFTRTNEHLSRFLAYASGFFLGPSITFLFPAGEELTTLPGHLAYPFSLAGMGLGMSLSPTMSAIIAQAFQYKWFFLVQSVLMFVKFACLMCSILLLHNMAADSVRHETENHSERGAYRLLMNEEEEEEAVRPGDIVEVDDKEAVTGEMDGKLLHPKKGVALKNMSRKST